MIGAGEWPGRTKGTTVALTRSLLPIFWAFLSHAAGFAVGLLSATTWAGQILRRPSTLVDRMNSSSWEDESEVILEKCRPCTNSTVFLSSGFKICFFFWDHSFYFRWCLKKENENLAIMVPSCWARRNSRRYALMVPYLTVGKKSRFSTAGGRGL